MAILPSCGSEPSLDDRTDAQIVATRFDPAFDFGAATTFAISPVVTTINDTSTTGGALPAAESAVVVDALVSHMVARGYRQTDIASRPDLGINATVFTRLKVETAVTTGLWWGLPGYGATPAFWGFPGGSYFAPWAYASAAFKSSTLIIQIVDLRNVQPTPMPALEVVWTAFLHSYISVGGTLLPEVPGAIDQAFVQSPYIESR